MKVAIAGYGVEGKANCAYWRAQGADVTIVDEHPLTDTPEGVAVITGDDAYSQLDGYDLVIRTAGLNPSKIRTSGKIWSGTNEFFAQCPAPIIGVTGTKGKGTTASLIASILHEAGKTVHLVGNIGVPALEVLPSITSNHIVVYELSSFQLWDLEKSPHVAVVLMIEADHLDVHKDMDEYVAAKANICKWQKQEDVAVYLSSVDGISKQIASLSKGQKIPYLYQTGAYIAEDYFWFNEQKICSLSRLKLPGGHNAENACAAIAAVREYVTDGEIIGRGLEGFSGLDHRLKLIKVVDGISYYDDSIATTPGSAIAAVEAFSKPKVIILGGSDKGADYSALIERCHAMQTVVISIGTLGPKIAELCREVGVPVKELGNASMQDIVTVASEVAQSGSVVILSPAAASFDMFKNYADRGDQFIAAVQAL